MTEFSVGDRVRVLSRSVPTPYAGRVGIVVNVARKGSNRPAVCYQVRLDGDADRSLPFWPAELELETGGTP